MTNSPRRGPLLLGGFAGLVVVAAIWLLVQTRSQPAAVSPDTSTRNASNPGTTTTPTTLADGGATNTAPHATAPASASAPATASTAASPALPAQTPAQREAAKADRLHWTQRAVSSHENHEKWTARGQALIDKIRDRADDVEDDGCFTIGCTATFTFASEAAYEDAYRDATTSATYENWHSGKRWTTPEIQPDGRIVVAVVIYREN